MQILLSATINHLLGNYLFKFFSFTFIKYSHFSSSSKSINSPLKNPLSALKNTLLTSLGNILAVCFINDIIPLDVYADPVLNLLLTTIFSSLTNANNG